MRVGDLVRYNDPHDERWNHWKGIIVRLETEKRAVVAWTVKGSLIMSYPAIQLEVLSESR